MTHGALVTLEQVESVSGAGTDDSGEAYVVAHGALVEALEAFCDAYPLEPITPPWYVGENAQALRALDGWRGVAGSEAQDALCGRRFDLPRRVEDFLFAEWLGAL